MALTSWAADVSMDLRYAARTLLRTPAFTAAAVLTLAVGLTGTIAMFSLVNGVLLSPLPVPSEQELFVGWRGLPEAGARQWPFTSKDLDLLRRESRLVDGVAGVGYNDPGTHPFVDGSETSAVRTSRVTGDFFRVLGVAPLLGRTLQPEDDRAGAENVVVLTRGIWERRFGGDPGVLGRRVTIGGQPFTIVGVMPHDVDTPRHVEAWLTVSGMQAAAADTRFKDAIANELMLLARLRPGVTAAQADAELRALAPAIDATRPNGDPRGFLPQIRPYREAVIGDVRAAIVVLFAAVALVLLIACANVSSLLLVRGDARRAEFAVRAALGAGRARLVRQLLVECLVLTAAAGVVAVTITTALLPALLAWVPDGLPRVHAVRIDGRVVLFSLAAAGLAATIATLLPAVSTGRARLVDGLGDASRGGTGGGRGPWRRALVSAQVALAVVGLVAVGLLSRSLLQLRRDARALASGQLVMAPLAIPQAKYADRVKWRQFVTALNDAIEADERVTAATPVNATPFDGTGWDLPVFSAEGQTDAEARANPPLNLEEVHPGYFRTFEVPIVRGRSFAATDDGTVPRVAIVSSDVAARVWPGQDPIGKRVKWGLPASEAQWLTVVGISAPTRYRTLQTPTASLYVPALQMLGGAAQIVVRTGMPLAQLADLVRARARDLDPDVGVMPLRPFDDLLQQPFARPRFYTLLMTGFGTTGLLLSAIGLYGVIAATVRQRRREIGIRLALGAEARHMRRLVLVEGVGLVAAGVLAGLLASTLATQALRSLLFGVHPLDPLALAGAVAGVILMAAAALVLPLRTASRVAPAEVLRTE